MKHPWRALKKIEKTANSWYCGILKRFGIMKVIFFLLTLLLLVFFFHEVKTVFLLGILLLAAALSTLYVRITQYSIGFELRTLLFVVVSYKISIMLGLILCICSIIIGTIISLNFHPTTIVTPVAYIILALLLPALLSYSATTVGIIITLAYNFILFIAYRFMFGYSIAYFGPGIMGNIILNIIIFMRAAEPLVRIL